MYTGRKALRPWGGEEKSRLQGPWVCWCESPGQAVRWADRDGLVWTQTTENTAGKGRPPVLQTFCFSPTSARSLAHRRDTF